MITAGFESADAGLIGKLEDRSEDESGDSAGSNRVMDFDSDWLGACAGVNEFIEAGLIGKLESRSVGELVDGMIDDWPIEVATGTASAKEGLIGNCELSNEMESDGLAKIGSV